MDVEYKGQHSIIFFKDTGKGYSKRNSWTDFHMIPASRPYVALGTPSIAQVAIPGTSKRYDITDFRPGGLTFGGRTGNWEFYIDHTKWDAWADANNTIRDYIHGGTFLINLTDDPYILYQGILTISGYVAGQSYSKITIQYDLMAETLTLDEPIDFGDFGKLPEITVVDHGLDLDGDGEKDVDLTTSIGYDTDCDGKPDAFVHIDPEKRPKRKLIYKAGSGKIEGLDVDGDGESDYYAVSDPTGKYGFDFDCDGFVDEDVSDLEYVDPHDLNIPEDKIPEGSKPVDEWKWVTGEDGEITGIDTTGDGEPDLDVTEGEDGGVTLVDPKDPTSPVISEPLPEPPKAQAPEEYDIPQTTVQGFDRDCDGIVDIPEAEISAKYYYDESGKVIGVDMNGDGELDNYAYEDPETGEWGLDLNCDGHQDVTQQADDPTSVIGAYYPLTFIDSDGTESRMYGFSSVTKSGKVLGVYDLYTIYESDKVTPDSPGGPIEFE